MVEFLSSATLSTDSQWEVVDCIQGNGYACKGPEGINFSVIKYGIAGIVIEATAGKYLSHECCLNSSNV